VRDRPATRKADLVQWCPVASMAFQEVDAMGGDTYEVT
jgi:hypothetical protein